MELIGYLLHVMHVYDYTSLVGFVINMLYGCTVRGQFRLLHVGSHQRGLKDLFLDPFHKQGGAPFDLRMANTQMSWGLKEGFVNIEVTFK